MTENSSLQAPWRIDYIRSLDRPDPDECFLCKAAQAADEASRRQCLVLWQSKYSVVMLNRYPYTNGHVLVAPCGHKADLDELNEVEIADVMQQTALVVRLLRRAVSAQGFNIGINLGRVAGAGVPGHLHQHIVPRWGGDINFMGIVGKVQVVPQALEQLYDELITIIKTGQ
ncbi:MAG: HIT domain-containing protein [Phycisphaerales bacterium]|nr:HIT domain-containing protein [Phycisphaerales bacterium]